MKRVPESQVLRSAERRGRVLPSATECYRVLPSVAECCRVLPSVAEYCRVPPLFIFHMHMQLIRSTSDTCLVLQLI